MAFSNHSAKQFLSFSRLPVFFTGNSVRDVNTGTNVFVGDANHGDDMSLDVMFATANEIQKVLSVTVVDGRIVESTVDATGAEYIGPYVPD